MLCSITSHALRWCALLVLVPVGSGQAQEPGGLPAFVPVNPVAQARSGLFAPVLAGPVTGWRGSASFDHASLIEYDFAKGGGSYLLDAEVSRLTLSLGRDLSPRYFLELGASIGRAQPGFMDGFFNWYHNLLGFQMPERELRPVNAFAYHMDLPDGRIRTRSQGTHLGDLRVSVGRRHSSRLQTLVTATLPVGGGGDGYARGTSSIATITTVLAPLGGRFSYQGSAGLGYTPRHGDLAGYQREILGSVASGLGLRIWGHQSLYAQVFYHSPYYSGTGYPALDRYELSLNYGWLLRAAGRTWRIGMTEDIMPSGPAIDASFEFGVSWD